MAVALAIFAIIFIAMSAYGVALPLKLTSFVRRFMLSPVGLWGAVVVRLLLAALLWLAAPDSHTPTTFRVLALLVMLAAVALPIIGAARLMKLIDYFASWPPMVTRIQCLFGVAIGAFLLWSVSPGLG